MSNRQQDPTDDRAPMAKAIMWSSRITTISMMMVVPGLIGHWIDGKLGTPLVFLTLGTAFGFTAGLYQLVRLGNKVSPKRRERQTQAGHDEQTPTSTE